MKQSMSFLLLCAISLVLILVVIAYYLFSKIAASTKSSNLTGTADGTDSLRKHGVTDLASKISYLSSNNEIQWPSEWTQIGTDATNCQVTTMHCQITSTQCFDLQAIIGSRFKLPIDSVKGSVEQTGYAIRKTATSLEIKACFAESNTAITQQLRF